MKLPEPLVRELTVEVGENADLAQRSTKDTRYEWVQETGRSTPQEIVDQDLKAFKTELEAAQELLYANGTWALLFIVQALDAAGKDGTIKHVMSGVNPQGCSVTSFKQPSAEELNHDFFWRCAKALPERGHIGIFNRSYYEEVLITHVHPEILAGQHLPPPTEHGAKLWASRYEDINAFERHLHRGGTRIIKVFLHLSKEEQKRRFVERLDDPTKNWKFSAADLAEREHFEEYQRVYDEVLTATSTVWAPWYVVPADHKHAARALVGGIITHVVESLDLQPPELSAEQINALDAARKTLLKEQV